MIDIKSLRIGSYFHYDEKIFVLKKIEGDFVSGDRGRGDVKFNIGSIKPIPLTEQILLDLGFEKRDDDYCKKIGDYRFMVNLFENDISVQGSLEELIGFSFDKLELNKLQNIVYDISGKELKFKN